MRAVGVFVVLCDSQKKKVRKLIEEKGKKETRFGFPRVPNETRSKREEKIRRPR